MHANTDTCLVLLRVQRGVLDLDLFSTDRGVIARQLEQLSSLKTAIIENVGRRSNDKHVYAGQELHHMQLLSCHAAAVTAMATQLGVLETSLQTITGSASNASCTSRVGSSTGSSRNTCGVSSSTQSAAALHLGQEVTAGSLWTVLFSSSAVFDNWPCIWPAKDPAEYTSVRNAMTHMMHIILRVTRSQSGTWASLAEVHSLEFRHRELQRLLFHPLSYIKNITQWPAAAFTSETSAIAPDFFPMFCCLSVEQLEDVATQCNTSMALQAANEPLSVVHGHYVSSVHASLSLPILHAGEVVLRFLQRLDKLDLDALDIRFVSPAMLQLFKRSLVLGRQFKDDVVGIAAHDESIIRTLALMLDFASNFNKKVLQHNMQTVLRECERSGAHLLPLCNLSVHVPDPQLMRITLRNSSDKSLRVKKLQYLLAIKMMMGWRQDTLQYVPFASPSKSKQAQGLFSALYYCALDTMAWMRGQQQQKQNSGPSSTNDVSCVEAPLDGLLTLMSIVYRKFGLLSRLVNMATQSGEICEYD